MPERQLSCGCRILALPGRDPIPVPHCAEAEFLEARLVQARGAMNNALAAGWDRSELSLLQNDRDRVKNAKRAHFGLVPDPPLESEAVECL